MAIWSVDKMNVMNQFVWLVVCIPCFDNDEEIITENTIIYEETHQRNMH